MDWEKTIFLAHASEDKHLVRRLYHKLKDHGLQPWLDEKALTPGVEWNTEIREAISKSRFFVACLSKNSVRKDGYVQRELRLALSTMEEKAPGNVYIIPGLLEELELPNISVGTINLKNYQYVKLFDPDDLERLIHLFKTQMGINEKTQSDEAREELESLGEFGLDILRTVDQLMAKHVALNQLGIAHYQKGDFEQAAKHWESALNISGQHLNKNDTGLLLNLSLLYEKGLGLDQDYDMAFDLMRKASDLGSATAKARLGKCYMNGWGVHQDIEIAISLIREAAEEGSVEGFVSLSQAYLFGEGVEQDNARGIDLLIKAAEMGNIEAQSTLSVIYASGGFGVESNLREATKWATSAAAQGDADAIDDLNRLVGEIR